MGSAVSGIGPEWNRPSVGGCASLWDWQNALATLISTILYNMMGYVEFPLILHKIVDDHGHHELGEFKTTIMGMLDTCGPWRQLHAAARTGHIHGMDPSDAHLGRAWPGACARALACAEAWASTARPKWEWT